MKGTIKCHFDDWKLKSRQLDLQNCYVSMDGDSQIVTVKAIKQKPKINTPDL